MFRTPILLVLQLKHIRHLHRMYSSFMKTSYFEKILSGYFNLLVLTSTKLTICPLLCCAWTKRLKRVNLLTWSWWTSSSCSYRIRKKLSSVVFGNRATWANCSLQQVCTMLTISLFTWVRGQMDCSSSRTSRQSWCRHWSRASPYHTVGWWR